MRTTSAVFVNVPIALAMIVAGHRYLSETPRGRGRFDITGAVSATLGVGALVYGVINAGGAGWRSPLTWGSLAIGGLLLVGLVVNEARAEQPIMPLRLFAGRERCGAYLVRMLYLGAMIGFFFFTTQYLQGVLGYGPLQAGLAFLPMSAVNFAVALVVPQLLRRFSSRLVLVAGVVLTLAGMLWLSRLTSDGGYLTAVALPMILIGSGQGLAFPPLTSAGIAGVSAHDAGAASGLLNTAHQLGSALGLAVITTVAGSGHLPHRVAAALTGGSVLLAIALIAVLVLIVPRPVPTSWGSIR